MYVYYYELCLHALTAFHMQTRSHEGTNAFRQGTGRTRGQTHSDKAPDALIWTRQQMHSDEPTDAFGQDTGRTRDRRVQTRHQMHCFGRGSRCIRTSRWMHSDKAVDAFDRCVGHIRPRWRTNSDEVADAFSRPKIMWVP